MKAVKWVVKGRADQDAITRKDPPVGTQIAVVRADGKINPMAFVQGSGPADGVFPQPNGDVYVYMVEKKK